MNALMFALLLCFVVVQVYVEAVNEGRGRHWWCNSLSDYLVGVRYAWLQDLSFLGLAATELLLIFARPRGLRWTILLVVAAAGLVGVVVTAIADYRHPTRWRAIAHFTSAGVAFTAGLVAEAIYLWLTPGIWFIWAALATVLVFTRFAPGQTALEEKFLTAWMVVALFGIIGVPT